MNDSFSPDLISLIDETGAKHEFEILDQIEENGTLYFALMPVFENSSDMLYDSGEYTILESVEENGEQQLAEVEDHELKRKLADIFEERFNDMFYNWKFPAWFEYAIEITLQHLNREPDSFCGVQTSPKRNAGSTETKRRRPPVFW